MHSVHHSSRIHMSSENTFRALGFDPKPLFPLKAKVLDDIEACFENMDFMHILEWESEIDNVDSFPLQLAKNLPLLTMGIRHGVRVIQPLSQAKSESDLLRRLTYVAQIVLPDAFKEMEKKKGALAQLGLWHLLLQEKIDQLVDETSRAIHNLRRSVPEREPLLLETREDKRFALLKKRVQRVLDRELKTNLYAWARIKDRPQPKPEPQIAPTENATCCQESAQVCCDCFRLAIGEILKKVAMTCPLSVIYVQTRHFETASNEPELLSKLQHVREITLPKLIELYRDNPSAKPFIKTLQRSGLRVEALIRHIQPRPSRRIAA